MASKVDPVTGLMADDTVYRKKGSFRLITAGLIKLFGGSGHLIKD
jgi:hypothetical protein